MTSLARRRRLLATLFATTLLGAGIAAGPAAAPAGAFVCNPIDECEHVPLPVDPTGNCWVSVHAIVDYGDYRGIGCVISQF